MRRSVATFSTAIAVLTLMGAPALAQQPATPAAPAAGTAEPTMGAMQTPWVKLCDKMAVDEKTPPTTKNACMIVQETRADTGQFLASAQIRDVEGEAKRIIVAVPVGMSIKPGVRVVIDQGQPAAMPYEVCFPNACFAQMELKDDVLAKMKKGQNLNIQVVNMANRPISLSMSLSGFAKSFDGPAVDPKEYEAQQKRLADELQRRAEEARKKLEEQGGGAQAPAPGVPGAPAGTLPSPVPVQPPKQ